MKRRFVVIIITVFLLSFAVYAESNLETNIQTFLSKGSFIVIKDGDTDTYYPKHIIAQIHVDENSLKITYIDREFDYETKSFNCTKQDITVDNDSNLVIVKK